MGKRLPLVAHRGILCIVWKMTTVHILNAVQAFAVLLTLAIVAGRILWWAFTGGAVVLEQALWTGGWAGVFGSDPFDLSAKAYWFVRPPELSLNRGRCGRRLDVFFPHCAWVTRCTSELGEAALKRPRVVATENSGNGPLQFAVCSALIGTSNVLWWIISQSHCWSVLQHRAGSVIPVVRVCEAGIGVLREGILWLPPSLCFSSGGVLHEVSSPMSVLVTASTADATC